MYMFTPPLRDYRIVFQTYYLNQNRHSYNLEHNLSDVHLKEFWQIIHVFRKKFVPIFFKYLTARGDTRTYNFQSEADFLYDWRFTAKHFVLATSLLRLTTSNFIFQLNTGGYRPYVTSSLTRRWVCRLQLLLALASAVILRSESHRTHDHILLSQIRDSPQPGGPGPRIYIPPNRVGRLYPQALGSLFVASNDSQGYGGGIRPRLHTGLLYDFKWYNFQFIFAQNPHLCRLLVFRAFGSS
jgi:hypothetical protein